MQTLKKLIQWIVVTLTNPFTKSWDVYVGVTNERWELRLDRLTLINVCIVPVLPRNSVYRIQHGCTAVASLEDADGLQHLAGGHGGGWVWENVSPPAAGWPRKFLKNILNTKSCNSDTFYVGSENRHCQCLLGEAAEWM